MPSIYSETTVAVETVETGSSLYNASSRTTQPAKPLVGPPTGFPSLHNHWGLVTLAFARAGEGTGAGVAATAAG